MIGLTLGHYCALGLAFLLGHQRYIMDNARDYISPALAQYIADYVNEELTEGIKIDRYSIMGAFVAFLGGAADE